MKSRKNYIAFAAGMATMVLLASLLSMSLAKEERPAPSGRQAGGSGKLSGQVAYGEAGIALFGVEQAAPGEVLTTARGARVPLVLTYTDEKGEAHYFVEAGTAAELLDVEYGAHYRESLHCVDFGSDCTRDELGAPKLLELPADDGSENTVLEEYWWTSEPRHDFDISLVKKDDGTWIGVMKDTPVQSGDISMSVSASGSPYTSDMPAELQKELLEKENQRWAERIQETPLKPEYGKTLGMFTEVDPAEMDTGSFSGASMKQKTLQEERAAGVEHIFAFTPLLGKYAAITLENPGKVDLWVSISREHTVGRGREGGFTTVRLPAGQKLTRAFRIDGSLPLENQLGLQVQAMAADTPTEVVVTAEQYRTGVRK